jgi:hypothetical protein
MIHGPWELWGVDDNDQQHREVVENSQAYKSVHADQVVSLVKPPIDVREPSSDPAEGDQKIYHVKLFYDRSAAPISELATTLALCRIEAWLAQNARGPEPLLSSFLKLCFQKLFVSFVVFANDNPVLLDVHVFIVVSFLLYYDLLVWWELIVHDVRLVLPRVQLGTWEVVPSRLGPGKSDHSGFSDRVVGDVVTRGLVMELPWVLTFGA